MGLEMNHVAQQFTSPPKLDDILEAQFSGDLERAHDLYVAHFESNEIRFDELNLFALCCMQAGKTEKAEKLFEVVTENAPPYRRGIHSPVGVEGTE